MASSSRMNAFAIDQAAITVQAADGFPIAAHRFAPTSHASARAVVVIVNATGVQARFYHDWACWLALQGVAAYTLDFRYSGASFPPQWAEKLAAARGDEEAYAEVFEAALRSAPDDIGLMRTWCREDLAAVAREAHASFPTVPMTFFGNSLGGHLITLLEPAMLQGFGVPVRFASVNGGNAHWRNHDEPAESRFGFNEVIIKPLHEERLFRASSLGLGFDIPYGPGLDWIGWYTHPCFSLNQPDDEARAKANVQRFQFQYFSFSDDARIGRHMMHQHVSLFCGDDKKVATIYIDPTKLDRWPMLGHVTCFRPTGPLKSVTAQEAVAGAPADGENDEAGRAIRGGEGYEASTPPSAAAAPEDEERQLGREETLWPLWLDYILTGQFDTSVGEYKRWTDADLRDCSALRREEEQARREEAREAEQQRQQQEPAARARL